MTDIKPGTAMAEGYPWYSHENEPAVSYAVIASVLGWEVEVGELVSAETGEPGGTCSILNSGRTEMEIVEVGGDLPYATVASRGEVIAHADRSAEIVGLILKYAPASSVVPLRPES